VRKERGAESRNRSDPFSSAYAYIDETGTLIQGVDFRPEGPQAIMVNLSKSPDSGIKATLMLKDNPKPKRKRPARKP
jgi:hypothetical protein